jgi:uracil-DNA glycosylase family 4
VTELEQLADQVRACQKCRLAQTRTRAVPGEGPANATVMLIGEGPGFHEDRQGRPFVGPSGNLLEQMLAGIGLSRQQVYITNVVKCRPPGNRDPQPDEIAACRPYLDHQIELIKPSIIVTLGRFSMARYFPGQSITRIHGQFKHEDGRVIIPMFHPAAALRNEQWMAALRQDFAKVPNLLARLGPDSEPNKSSPTDDDFEQLSFL